jgi:hypothetical protein
MKFKENTRHHFVPQCYLKQFAASKDSGIYLYDKCLSKDNYAPKDEMLFCFIKIIFRFSKILLALLTCKLPEAIRN